MYNTSIEVHAAAYEREAVRHMTPEQVFLAFTTAKTWEYRETIRETIIDNYKQNKYKWEA